MTFPVFLRLAKPECNNVLQPDQPRGSGCNTLSHSSLANVNHAKECFILSFHESDKIILMSLNLKK